MVTYDLDVCYARTDDDLMRMSAALDALHARLRVAREDAELVFPPDERSLRLGDSFTLTTDLGPFDILGTPSGTAGYADLDAGATEFDLGDGVRVRVASVDDLIRMKRASARAKDFAQLAHLEALREEIDHLQEDGIDPQQGR